MRQLTKTIKISIVILRKDSRTKKLQSRLFQQGESCLDILSTSTYQELFFKTPVLEISKMF